MPFLDQSSRIFWRCRGSLMKIRTDPLCPACWEEENSNHLLGKCCAYMVSRYSIIWTHTIEPEELGKVGPITLLRFARANKRFSLPLVVLGLRIETRDTALALGGFGCPPESKGKGKGKGVPCTFQSSNALPTLSMSCFIQKILVVENWTCKRLDPILGKGLLRLSTPCSFQCTFTIMYIMFNSEYIGR